MKPRKKVAAHDKAEKARIKEQKAVRADLMKAVNELEQMYEAGVLQDDLPGIEETTED